MKCLIKSTKSVCVCVFGQSEHTQKTEIQFSPTVDKLVLKAILWEIQWIGSPVLYAFLQERSWEAIIYLHALDPLAAGDPEAFGFAELGHWQGTWMGE